MDRLDKNRIDMIARRFYPRTNFDSTCYAYIKENLKNSGLLNAFPNNDITTNNIDDWLIQVFGFEFYNNVKTFMLPISSSSTDDPVDIYKKALLDYFIVILLGLGADHANMMGDNYAYPWDIELGLCDSDNEALQNLKKFGDFCKSGGNLPVVVLNHKYNRYEVYDLNLEFFIGVAIFQHVSGVNLDITIYNEPFKGISEPRGRFAVDNIYFQETDGILETIDGNLYRIYSDDIIEGFTGAALWSKKQFNNFFVSYVIGDIEYTINGMNPEPIYETDEEGEEDVQHAVNPDYLDEFFSGHRLGSDDENNVYDQDQDDDEFWDDYDD